jgi:prepilin-type N-terminal cleavage/methylation domain-containing protein
MSRMEGFTLIEIIAAITLTAVVAAFFVQYMGSALMYSAKPVNILKETYAINQVMAKITVGYRNELKNGTLVLSDFKGTLSSFNDVANSVTCSGMFLNFRDVEGGGTLLESNGIITPVESDPDATKFLLVTASKSNRSMRILLTEE